MSLQPPLRIPKLSCATLNAMRCEPTLVERAEDWRCGGLFTWRSFWCGEKGSAGEILVRSANLFRFVWCQDKNRHLPMGLAVLPIRESSILGSFYVSHNCSVFASFGRRSYQRRHCQWPRTGPRRPQTGGQPRAGRRQSSRQAGAPSGHGPSRRQARAASR
jgi:hypothetical protein